MGDFSVFLVAALGFVFGFFGSVPVGGPIAVLVLGHGMEGRNRAGLWIALGAALPEAAYAYLAFWGVSELLQEYPFLDLFSRAAGAVIVVSLGLWLLLGRRRARPADQTSSASEAAARPRKRRGIKRNFALGFVITALNPALLATWSAAVPLATALLPFRIQSAHAAPFAVGACIGIASWFSLLLTLLRRFRSRMSASKNERIKRITGAVILVVGCLLSLRAMGWVEL